MNATQDHNLRLYDGQLYDDDGNALRMPYGLIDFLTPNPASFRAIAAEIKSLAVTAKSVTNNYSDISGAQVIVVGENGTHPFQTGLLAVLAARQGVEAMRQTIVLALQSIAAA